MKDLLEKWKKCSKEEIRRFLKLLAIPLIVIILIVIVAILDKPGQEGMKEPKDVTEASEGSAAGEDESTAAESEKIEITLQKDAVPEIRDLMEAYFKARMTCDIEAFSNVYGDTLSQEELNVQSAELEEEVKFYQSFESLVYYTAPGLEDGDYVVYARVDIKFRQAETLAPSLNVCYAKTAADGSCYLVANISSAQSRYMAEVNKSDQVQALAAEVNGGLVKALQSDENLLAVYHTLLGKKGEPEGMTESSVPEENTTEETEAASESGSESDNR